MTRRILTALLFLLPTLVSVHTLESFEFPKVLLLHTGAILLCMVGLHRGLLVYPMREGELCDATRSPLLISLGMLCLSAIVSAIFGIAPYQSLFGTNASQHGLLTIGSYMMLTLAAFFGLRTWDGPRLLRAALWASVPAMLYYFAQIAGLDPLQWKQAIPLKETFRTGGTLGHPNYLSCYLVMTLPIALHEHYKARGRLVDRLVLKAIITSMLVVLLLTQSRGSWQALGAMGLFWLLTSSDASDKKLFAIIGSGLMSWWLIAFGALKVLGETKHTVIKSILERVVNIAHLDVPRAEYWLGALRIWKKYPFFGAGTDLFQLAYEHVRSQRYWWAEFAGAPHRAHNEFLNLLATQGAVGASLGLMFILILAITIKRLLARYEHSIYEKTDTPGHAVMLACICIGFLVQGFTSFTVVATGSLFAVVLGLLARMELGHQPHMLTPPQTVSPRLLTVRGALTLVIVALGLCDLYPFVAKRLIADLYARQSVTLSQANPQTGIILIDQALLRQPKNTAYLEILGAQASRFADVVGDPEMRKGLRKLAIRSFLTAQGTVEAQAGYWYLTGREMALATKDGALGKDGAESAYRELWHATEREPDNVVYLTGATELMLMLGRCDLAGLWIPELKHRYPEAQITWDLATAQAFCLGDTELTRLYRARALSNTKTFYDPSSRPELTFEIDAQKLEASLKLLEEKKLKESRTSKKAKR